MILLGTPTTLFIETGHGALGNKWSFTLPPEFNVVMRNDFILYAENHDGLRIAVSAALYDGGAYIHASCSRQDRMPSYYDLRDLKAIAFGPERYACQVFPPESEHVNIHPFCLHLWGPMQAKNWPLPDFTEGQSTI